MNGVPNDNNITAKYKLVVIDDEYIVVEGIKAIIQREKMNCEVVGAAYNGIDGLEVLREKKPDIVITDIRIPGLDGLSLIETAKEFLPDTAFIVISGYTEFEYARRALHLGVKSYIDKPVTIDKVAEAIGLIDKEYERERREREVFYKEESFQKSMSGLSDSMIAAILNEDAPLFLDNAEKILDQIGIYTASIERYKQESFRMLCVAAEVFAEQKHGQEPIHVSYSEIEKLDTMDEVHKYIWEAAKSIAGKMEAGKIGCNHRIINQVLSYISEHYNEDIGLNELADMVSFNPAYLSILFKSEVGMSYVKYLANFRINKAKELLLKGYKVAEVSEMVGYSNYRYFCDIFKKHVGKTPNEYKGIIRKKDS